MVKPGAKKRAVNHIIETLGLSERRACILTGLSRMGYRYQNAPSNDKKIRSRLKQLAQQYSCYGYLLLHGMLKNERLVVNHKRTYRIYIEERLQVRTKKRKKLIRPRIPIAFPLSVNERWSMDFVCNQLANGRRFRDLNVVGDYSRECVGQLVDTLICGNYVAWFLDQLIESREKPRAITCDNVQEFTSKALFFWASEGQVKLQFIQSGKPTQSAFVASFNGKLRDNHLNQHWFKDLEEARSTIEEWRKHLTQVRPHISLGYITLAVFAGRAA